MRTPRTLIIADLQYDFLEGGSLAVPGADSGYVQDIESIRYLFDQVILTADHHPKHHISFTIFPPHCIAGTHGSELAVAPGDLLLLKGQDIAKDEFSAFAEGRNIDKIRGKDVYVSGLAGDYCVKQTLTDLIEFAPDRKIIALTDLIKNVDGSLFSSVDHFYGKVVYMDSSDLH